VKGSIRVLDVSGLPTYAYGHRSLMWWGTFGMIVIESTVFALAVGTYFYLRGLAITWPPHGVPPVLTYGTLNTAILLVSAIPNHWTKHQADKENLRGTRIGLVICLLFGTAFIVVRGFEFGALQTSWNTSAYGSIVWALLLLHTVHLVTDFIDSVVLTVLMFTGPLSGRRFVDVSENSVYWWFVVVSWLFIYATIYLAPRLPP
jgi:heme/copper-type cytochrome/quinol oxidase subunit 3